MEVFQILLMLKASVRLSIAYSTARYGKRLHHQKIGYFHIPTPLACIMVEKALIMCPVFLENSPNSVLFL